MNLIPCCRAILWSNYCSIYSLSRAHPSTPSPGMPNPFIAPALLDLLDINWLYYVIVAECIQTPTLLLRMPHTIDVAEALVSTGFRWHILLIREARLLNSGDPGCSSYDLHIEMAMSIAPLTAMSESTAPLEYLQVIALAAGLWVQCADMAEAMNEMA